MEAPEALTMRQSELCTEITA